MDYKGFSSSSTSFNGFGNRTQANFNLAGPSGSTGLNRPVQNNIANGVNSGGYPPTSQNTNMVRFKLKSLRIMILIFFLIFLNVLL